MKESPQPNNRPKSVAFSGHRSFKLKNSAHGFDHIREALRSTLRGLCGQGYDTFYTGMAEGFDLVAAQEIITLKSEFADVRLIAVIPFAGQAQHYYGLTMQSYVDVLEHSDGRVILSGEYHARCFHERNNYLADSSSVLVCYYNGAAGGTRYTVERAKKSGHTIINLGEWREEQLSLDF